MPQISLGDQPPKRKVLILGLAAKGLTKLGLPAETSATFPMAYTMNMAHPVRTNILSDTGDDKPQDWLWGAQECTVDAVLMVYADSAPTLGTSVANLANDLTVEGGHIAHRVTLAALPKREGE